MKLLESAPIKHEYLRVGLLFANDYSLVFSGAADSRYGQSKRAEISQGEMIGCYTGILTDCKNNADRNSYVEGDMTAREVILHVRWIVLRTIDGNIRLRLTRDYYDRERRS